MHLCYELNGSQVTITLHDGEKRSEFEDDDIKSQCSYNVGELPQEFVAGEDHKTLAGYGLLKLLQDRTSQDKGHQEKFDAMESEFERLASGQWRKTVERAASTGAGGRRKVDVILAQAVAELKGISVTQASAALKGLEKAQYEALSGSEVVKSKMAELRDAAGEEECDLADLF